MEERSFEKYTTGQIGKGLKTGAEIIGAIFAPVYQAEKPVVNYLVEKAKRKVVVSVADRWRKAGVTYRRMNRARMALA